LLKVNAIAIFELNKKFGYKKFIILIPAVPIREGTKTNLEDTKEYFKQFYANEREKEIEVFVYESRQISSVEQFICTEHLSVLVMTPSSFDGDMKGISDMEKRMERELAMIKMEESKKEVFGEMENLFVK